MFNLDLTTSKPETKDKSDTEDKWRSVKIIVGSAIGYITALLFFYTCNRVLAQEIQEIRTRN